MRWALIGGGDVAGKRLFAALRQAQGSELVCLIGRDPERTREAEAMVEACEAAGVTLQVAYYRRFYPKLKRIAELIQSGAIGTPVSVHAQFSE
ncbi:MAG: hypothetical protein ACOY94_16425 [Bacillota bacterium]